MPPDLFPLFIGTAYACLGLSALRLARLDGRGLGWTRLCVAGLGAALSEWYLVYALAFDLHQTNDLVGSLLALVSLGAFLEFTRHTLSRRLKLGRAWRTLAGIALAGLGIAAIAAGTGGTYDRFVFAQRAAGLTLAGIALVAILPYRLRGAAWIRGAGLALLAGLLAVPGLRNVWMLVPGIAAAAVFLRIVCIVRHDDTRRVLGRWAALEYAVVALLLTGAVLNARHRGLEVMQLEERQLLRITEAAAAAFEPANVRALAGAKSDEGTAAHATVSRRLLTIQKIARSTTSGGRDSRFAYLMALRDGRVVFLADQPQDPEAPTSPGDPYDEASAELRAALVDGKPFLEGPLPDRFGVWVSGFAPIRDTDGSVLALLGIDFDAQDWTLIEKQARLLSILNWTLIMTITLSLFTSVGLGIEAQQKLRRSEHLFRTAADYTSTWEYWVGADGHVVFTSLASEALTGYPPARFENHPRLLLRITHPGDRARMVEHLRACRRDAPACQFDFKITRRNGDTAWISHSCESVYDEQGLWSGRRASNRDITNLRRTELALARQERLQTGCHQALRRLLGRHGSDYLSDALQLAAQAGGCKCAGIFRIGTGHALQPLELWPSGTAVAGALPWDQFQKRALPILAAGDTFELLPRETAATPGPLSGTHIAILPLLERGELAGIVVFVSPPEREQWSKAELAALATLASGLSIALERGKSAAG